MFPPFFSGAALVTYFQIIVYAETALAYQKLRWIVRRRLLLIQCSSAEYTGVHLSVNTLWITLTWAPQGIPIGLQV